MRYDFRHLNTFVAVAEELNFHKAAERLNMAQPAVSRIISELEVRIQVKLLERTTRSVRLTDSGRYFLEKSRGILEEINSVERTTQQLAAGVKAELSIGYTTITGHSLVPDIVYGFRKLQPDVHLDLHYLSSPQQLHQILDDKIDFGFLVGDFMSPEIETCLVARHDLVVLLTPEHPLAAQSEVTVEDLAKEALVIGSDTEWPTFRRIIQNMFQSEDQVLRIGQEATSLIGILGLVTAGIGVTIFCGLPRFCSEKSIVSRPIKTAKPIVVETYLAWRRRRVSFAMTSFIANSKLVGGVSL
jgi:DNA-binding transcriptional LysR family regulator